MGNLIDKSLIINRLRNSLNIESDRDLADHLGIKPNTLSNWRARNNIDYDLIFTKCDFLDFHWLITGETFPGRSLDINPVFDEMSQLAQVRFKSLETESNLLRDSNHLLKEIIGELKFRISSLEKENSELKKELDSKNTSGYMRVAEPVEKLKKGK